MSRKHIGAASTGLVLLILTGSPAAGQDTIVDPSSGRRIVVPPNVAPLSEADSRAQDEQAIGRVLDELHASASRADATAYFALFAPDAVFIGTDVSERWTLEQFRSYAQPIFAQGRGWTYTLRGGSRRIVLDASRNVAWFDEVLDSSSYGTSRGTGVLLADDVGRWRIAQYHLTFPIPNALAPEFTRRIREHEGGRPSTP